MRCGFRIVLRNTIFHTVLTRSRRQKIAILRRDNVLLSRVTRSVIAQRGCFGEVTGFGDIRKIRSVNRPGFRRGSVV